MRESFRWPRRTPDNHVDRLLAQVRDVTLDQRRLGHRDDFLCRLESYLGWAQRYGLGSEQVAGSCTDLARTLSQDRWDAGPRMEKSQAWAERRQAALRTDRPPRTIDMELDPVYFDAILRGRKTFEGRAYKPDSDKDYPDIRHGDTIVFTMSDRQPWFELEAQGYGLSMRDVMVCPVQDVHFAPTVHGVYQMSPDFNGDAFQPMVGVGESGSEHIQLQRAAVYYSFPGYPELIRDHGFLGIELAGAQLAA